MATEYSPGEYLALITSEHNSRSRFIKTVEQSVKPFTDIQTTVWNMVDDFDLEAAIGAQLDAVGTRIGVKRSIQLYTPDIWFSWDKENLGWDDAPWFAGDISPGGLQDLTDAQFRVLIKARIIANKWNGTVTNAYQSYDLLFRYFGCEILIQPYNFMTMLVLLMCPSTPSPLQLGLFVGHYLELRPNGMKLWYAMESVPNAPVFAFDVDNANLKGWDDGNWAIVLDDIPFAGRV